MATPQPRGASHQHLRQGSSASGAAAQSPRTPRGQHAHEDSSAATVYEHNINEEYRFYSNPVSRQNSETSIAIASTASGSAPGRADGWPTQAASQRGIYVDTRGSSGIAAAATTSPSHATTSPNTQLGHAYSYAGVDGPSDDGGWKPADKVKKNADAKVTSDNDLPALYDPFVRRQISKLKTHQPWFLGIVTIIQIIALAVSFYLNFRMTGSIIQTNPFNYLIGPTSGILITMGARFVPCMKSGTGFDAANLIIACPAGILGSQVNGTGCTLLDVCSWNGFPSGRPDQWWRYFVAILLHGGVLHILFNLSLQVQTGFQLEKDMGWWRMAIIYTGSGVGGFVFGASLSDVNVPSVGASGALYGLVACLLLDLLQNWSLIKRPWIELIKMLANIIFALLLGTLPYIDNLAHVGGFITGILLGIIFMPKIYFGKWDRRRKYILLFLAIPSTAIYFYFIVINVYSGNNTCTWCKYFNCIPGMPWCDQKFNVTTSVNFNATSS